MSNSIAEPQRIDEQQLHNPRHGASENQQDQEHHTSSATIATDTAIMAEANEPEVRNGGNDISAGQKMLSAVSGSLLTSLLGTILQPARPPSPSS